MHPMQIDVITPIPARWGLCGASCLVGGAVAERALQPDDSLEDLPPQARRDLIGLVAFLRELGRTRPWLRFRLIDPRSLQGLWLSLRHGVHRYPAFVVPGARRDAGADPGAPTSAPRPRWSRFVQALRDFLYGATVYEMVRDLRRERGQLEHLFVLVVFGDFLGIPVLPPYYTLRLLPYVVPAIRGWKLSMLRERDFTELFVEEIH